MLLVLTGKPVRYQPYAYAILAEAGIRSDDETVADLESTRFSLVLLRFDPDDPRASTGDFSAEVVKAIRDNYEVRERYLLHTRPVTRFPAEYFLLRPRAAG